MIVELSAEEILMIKSAVASKSAFGSESEEDKKKYRDIYTKLDGITISNSSDKYGRYRLL